MLFKFIKQHSLISHILVLLQLSGLVFSCYPVGLQNLGNVYWLALCACGIGLGIYTLFFNKIGNFSVYPEIRSHAKLITTGPYRFIRHPMYVSLIIMMIGIALYNYHWINFVGVVMVTVAVIGKATIEEKLLGKHFADYCEYQSTTKRFVPYIY